MVRIVQASPKTENATPYLAESLQIQEEIKRNVPDNFVEFCSYLYFLDAGKRYEFKLFPYQVEIANRILSGEYDLMAIIKSRQMGLTSLIAALIAWLMLRFSGYKVIIISLSQYESSALARHIRSLLGEWDVDPIIDNVRTLQLDNGSTLRAFPNNSDAGRSFTGNLTLLDECGMYENLNQILQGSAPTQLWSVIRQIEEPALQESSVTSTPSITLLVTTPGKKSSDFYQQYCSDGTFEDLRGRLLASLSKGQAPLSLQFSDLKPRCLLCVCHITAIPMARDNLPEIRQRLEPLLGGKKGWEREFDILFTSDDDLGTNFNFDLINEADKPYKFNVATMSLTDGMMTMDLSQVDRWFSHDPANSGSDHYAVLQCTFIPDRKILLVLSENYWVKRGEFMDALDHTLNHLGRVGMILETNGIGNTLLDTFKGELKRIKSRLKIKPHVTTELSKREAIYKLDYLLESGRLWLCNCPTLKAQLITYNLAKGKGESNAKDDGVAALLHFLSQLEIKSL